ncbi:hypothetical protein BGZ81_009442 [Podila clonocystis]|nr:hypothetical protein BGZ81_009442 [Podila clonocystis]
MNYILRIPFREMVGNVTRPYDPTGPQPLADIPMSIPPPTRPLPPAQTAGDTGVSGPGAMSATDSGTDIRGGRTLFSLSSSSPTSTQGQPKYLAQVQKAWAERTGDISMALMAAFFSSAIVTVIAIAALALNWSKECTYLKVYMVVFVVRKWIMTAIMIDRALYRLPLNLVECDPDIDEERYNGIAIYMSDLFTWHGYAMLFAGSFYVYGYATVHYLSSAPVITSVALVFASMGLVPFFALLALIFMALSCLYVLYILFICFVWPFEKCGLSRRRAISRRNGGYRSNGTTNTTDLAQLGNSSSLIGFGGCDNIKVTPAMAAIPIVVFRKPVKTVIPSEKAASPAVGRDMMEKHDADESVEALQQHHRIHGIIYLLTIHVFGSVVCGSAAPLLYFITSWIQSLFDNIFCARYRIGGGHGETSPTWNYIYTNEQGQSEKDPSSQPQHQQPE